LMGGEGSPPPPPMMGGGGMMPPPPPPGMGMKGPPPPGGMMNAGPPLPKIAIYKPKAQLRKVHADVINKKKINGTIFATAGVCEGTLKVNIDEVEMEKLFALKEADPKKSEDSEAEKAVEVKSLLEPKRSYNVSIKLGAIKMKYEEVKKAILQMDEGTLSTGLINTLREIVPTESEVELFKSHADEDPQYLAEPDKFMMSLMDIPHVQARLEAWCFKQKYLSEMTTAQLDLDTLSKACKELKSSKEFSRLLSIILAITNYLNSGGPKKDSYGFKMVSLTKLRDVKTTMGEAAGASGLTATNLLEYLIMYIQFFFVRRMPSKKEVTEEFKLNKKDEKKVQKLQSQIEFHAIRGEKAEVEKLRSQIEKITADGKKAAGL